MELRSQAHGVDGNGLFVWVEDDDFEQLPTSIGADEQDPVGVLGDLAQRHTDGVSDVLVGDAMPAGAVRDLQ